MAKALFVDHAAGVMQADRAADPALRDHARLVVEAHAEQLAGLEEQRIAKPFQPPGPILLGDAQDDGDALGRHVGDQVQAFAQRTGKQAGELGDAAPGLVQRHFAADDPLAAAGDETGLLEVVDRAADRRAARLGSQAHAGHHAAAENGDRRHGHAISSSSASDWCARISASIDG